MDEQTPASSEPSESKAQASPGAKPPAEEAVELAQAKNGAATEAAPPHKKNNIARLWHVLRVFSDEQLTSLLVIVLIGAALLALSRYPLRLDLTADKLNTLSSLSELLVRDLQDPMRIKVFMSRNLPPPLNALEQDLKDVLTEYKSAARGNFVFNFYEIDEQTVTGSPKLKANLELARDYGINPRSVQTIEKDAVKLINVYSGMVIEYGNIIERIPFIADSEALEYQLSSLFKKVTDKVNTLLQLDGTIAVSLHLGDDFVELAPFFGIRGLDNMADELNNAITELNQEYYSKLDFVHVQRPVTIAEQGALTQLGLQLYPWNDFEANNREYAAGIGAAALVLQYADTVQVIEMLSREEVLQLTGAGLQSSIRYQVLPLAALEARVKGALNALLEITPPLAYLNEKGTVDFAQDSYEAVPQRAQSVADAANFAAALKQRYELTGVSLAELSPQVHPVLIIAGAKEAFSDYELYQLDQYIMRGGHLALLNDSFVEVTAAPGTPPSWQKNDTGLARLVEHYGLRIDASIVMDKVSFVNRNQNQQNATANQQPIYFVPLIQNQKLNKKLSYMRNVKGVFFIAGSPLFLVADTLTKTGVTAEWLFSSSEQSWNVADDVTLVPYLIHPPANDDDYTSFELAYMLEGPFKSYFADKDIPKPEAADEGEAAADDTGRDAAVQQFAGAAAELSLVKQAPAGTRLFVMGSSEVIKNNVVDSAGKAPNAVLMLNVIDAISGAADWAVMRAKGQRINPLDIQVNAEVPLSVWKRPAVIRGFNMVGLPLMIVLAGLWVYGYKQRLRRRVAAQFGADKTGV